MPVNDPNPAGPQLHHLRAGASRRHAADAAVGLPRILPGAPISASCRGRAARARRRLGRPGDVDVNDDPSPRPSFPSTACMRAGRESPAIAMAVAVTAVAVNSVERSVGSRPHRRGTDAGAALESSSRSSSRPGLARLGQPTRIPPSPGGSGTSRCRYHPGGRAARPRRAAPRGARPKAAVPRQHQLRETDGVTAATTPAAARRRREQVRVQSGEV